MRKKLNWFDTRTVTKIPLMYFFLGIARPQAPFPQSVSDLYSPRIGQHISSSRIGIPIMEIYKSLIDAWMWKLGLRPRYSFSGNICFKISVFCLCSASAHYSEYSRWGGGGGRWPTRNRGTCEGIWWAWSLDFPLYALFLYAYSPLISCYPSSF